MTNLLIALAGLIILSLALVPIIGAWLRSRQPNSAGNLRTVPMAGAALRQAALWTAGVCGDTRPGVRHRRGEGDPSPPTRLPGSAVMRQCADYAVMRGALVIRVSAGAMPPLTGAGSVPLAGVRRSPGTGPASVIW